MKKYTINYSGSNLEEGNGFMGSFYYITAEPVENCLDSLFYKVAKIEKYCPTYLSSIYFEMTVKEIY